MCLRVIQILISVRLLINLGKIYKSVRLDKISEKTANVKHNIEIYPTQGNISANLDKNGKAMYNDAF